MQTVLIFLIVLGIVVIIHELGHFTVAKLARIPVLEFGFGYPPRIFSFKRGQTVYSINLLPLGGFVKFVGEEDPTDPRSLASKPALTRMAVLGAGPGMNLLLAIVLFTILFMVPREIPVTNVVVGGIVPNSPAAEALLKPGDILREVGGRSIDNSSDLRTAIQVNLGNEIPWVVQRNERLLQTRLIPRMNPPEGEPAVGLYGIVDARVTISQISQGSTAESVGIAPSDLLLSIDNQMILNKKDIHQIIGSTRDENPNTIIPLSILRRGEIIELKIPPDIESLNGVQFSVIPEELRSKTLFKALSSSFDQIWDILIMSKNELMLWFHGGTTTTPLTGPIGIAQITGQMAQAGPEALVFWTALLSLSLAILNILPIPALDGGRITFVLLELARGGRRVSSRIETLIHTIGFAGLMTLIVIVTIADLQRVFGNETLISP